MTHHIKMQRADWLRDDASGHSIKFVLSGDKEALRAADTKLSEDTTARLSVSYTREGKLAVEKFGKPDEPIEPYSTHIIDKTIHKILGGDFSIDKSDLVSRGVLDR